MLGVIPASVKYICARVVNKYHFAELRNTSATSDLDGMQTSGSLHWDHGIAEIESRAIARQIMALKNTILFTWFLHKNSW